MLGSHTEGEIKYTTLVTFHICLRWMCLMCSQNPYLYYVVLAGDLHGLLTVIQGSEDRVTSPVKEQRHAAIGVCPCVCGHRRRVFILALPEFELAAHLSVFDLYELIVAG